jgi:hypothetical protein
MKNENRFPTRVHYITYIYILKVIIKTFNITWLLNNYFISYIFIVLFIRNQKKN